MLQRVETALQRPANMMTRFFDGKREARGLIVDRFGHIRRRIHVTMEGWWNGSDFCLDEVFSYDNGDVETRQWVVSFDAEGGMRASCPDLPTPIEGRIDGDEIRMNYPYTVPLNGMAVSMRFDDRMYLLDNDTIYQRVVMSKFGIRLAEITLVFCK